MLRARIVACVVMVGALNACHGVSKIDHGTLTAPTVQARDDTPVRAEQGASVVIAASEATTQPPSETSVPDVSKLAPLRPTPTSESSALSKRMTVADAVAVAASPSAMATVSPPAAKTATLPRSAQVGHLVNIQQTLNNCGPASVAEVLRFWGISRTQEQVQLVLRSDGNPRGMVPYGIPSYMQTVDIAGCEWRRKSD
jgi:hypothetical protein